MRTFAQLVLVSLLMGCFCSWDARFDLSDDPRADGNLLGYAWVFTVYAGTVETPHDGKAVRECTNEKTDGKYDNDSDNWTIRATFFTHKVSGIADLQDAYRAILFVNNEVKVCAYKYKGMIYKEFSRIIIHCTKNNEIFDIYIENKENMKTLHSFNNRENYACGKVKERIQKNCLNSLVRKAISEPSFIVKSNLSYPSKY